LSGQRARRGIYLPLSTIQNFKSLFARVILWYNFYIVTVIKVGGGKLVCRGQVVEKITDQYEMLYEKIIQERVKA